MFFYTTVKFIFNGGGVEKHINEPKLLRFHGKGFFLFIIMWVRIYSHGSGKSPNVP